MKSCIKKGKKGDISESKVVIIRHAQSEYNYAYINRNYHGNPDHDPNLIDAEISKKGLQQC